MELKERITAICDYYNVTKAEFERKCGLSNGYVNSVKRTIGEKKLSQILECYPNINKSWLALGEGPMFEGKNNDLSKNNERAKASIPLVPIEAMAGALRGEETVMEYDCERYIIPHFSDADFLIAVRGNSMYPKFQSGDIVACKRISINDHLFFQWNKVYVIDTNQGVIIKRIKPGADEAHISIVSENPDFDTFQLHREEIYSIALVVGLIRAE